MSDEKGCLATIVLIVMIVTVVFTSYATGVNDRHRSWDKATKSGVTKIYFKTIKEYSIGSRALDDIGVKYDTEQSGGEFTIIFKKL